MLKNKKVILVALLVGVVLLGSTVGVVLAQGGNGSSTSQSEARDALLERAAQIYQEKTGVTIDAQQLKDAFAQAQKEMQDKALEEWLQNLVDNGRITQEQADAYLQWWQARPDSSVPGLFGRGFGFGGPHGGMRGGCWGAPEPTPDTSGSST